MHTKVGSTGQARWMKRVVGGEFRGAEWGPITQASEDATARVYVFSEASDCEDLSLGMV